MFLTILINYRIVFRTETKRRESCVATRNPGPSPFHVHRHALRLRERYRHLPVHRTGTYLEQTAPPKDFWRGVAVPKPKWLEATITMILSPLIGITLFATLLMAINAFGKEMSRRKKGGDTP